MVTSSTGNPRTKRRATRASTPARAANQSQPAVTGADAFGGRSAADDPLSTFRVQYLLDLFTSKGLAEWIGVSPSQTSRWSSGKERPSPAAAPALIDLEHVYARARLVWGEDAARIWLQSPNSYLGGPRPLDVLRADGPSRVLECLDAEMWGGAA